MEHLTQLGVSAAEVDDLTALSRDRRALDGRLRLLGLTKVGHRCAVSIALEEEARKAAVPAANELRIAVVCHSGYFQGGYFIRIAT